MSMSCTVSEMLVENSQFEPTHVYLATR